MKYQISKEKSYILAIREYDHYKKNVVYITCDITIKIQELWCKYLRQLRSSNTHSVNIFIEIE